MVQNFLTGLFILGVVLDWLACFANSLGNALLRYDSILLIKSPVYEKCQKHLYSGFGCFVIGGIMDIFSLALIPLSVWACNTSLSIPMSAVIAYFMLGEIMTKLHWISMIIIIVGSIGAILTGCREDNTEAVGLLVQSLQHWFSILLTTVMLIIQFISGYLTYKHKKFVTNSNIKNNEHQLRISEREIKYKNKKAYKENKKDIHSIPLDIHNNYIKPVNKLHIPNNNNNNNLPDNHIKGNDGSSDLDLSTDNSVRSNTSTFLSHDVEVVIDKIGQVIPSALLPAIQTCWTSVFLKCFTNKIILISNGGSTEFTAIFIISIIALCISIPLQLKFIQWMMHCHDCVIAIPVYQCFMIFLTTLFGIIFYQERPASWFGFIVSLTVSCVGILIITCIPGTNNFKELDEDNHDEDIENEEDNIKLCDDGSDSQTRKQHIVLKTDNIISESVQI